MPEEKKQEEVKKPVEAQIKEASPSKAKSKGLVLSLIVIIVLLAGGCGVLAWQSWEKYDTNKQQADQITALQKELAELKEASESSSSSSSSTTTPTTAATSLKENIEAAINTMNTAALEGYMADSVFVVYAATEYAGNRTPAQAVADLDYLSSATPPWNFSLPATTLAAFDAGFYTDYFNPNSIVGMSSDNYVVSFNIDATGAIDGIFVCVHSDLLL